MNETPKNPPSIKRYPRTHEDAYQVNFGYGWLRLRKRKITARRDDYGTVTIELDRAMKDRLGDGGSWDRAELVGLRDLIDAVLVDDDARATGG